jgi:predicted RecB family endonuclease
MDANLIALCVAGAILAMAVIANAIFTDHREEQKQMDRRERAAAEKLSAQQEKLRKCLVRNFDALSITILQHARQDAYGNWIYSPIYKEAAYFIDNVIIRDHPELLVEYVPDLAPSVHEHLRRLVISLIDDILEQEAEVRSGLGSTGPSNGLAYEREVAGELSALGFSIQYTPASGDHGVDLLAERPGLKLAVQCKDYTGSVGNDAVQQVYSGARFYNMDEAIVVSPTTYTPAALTLAQKLNVSCLHHRELMSRYGQSLHA